MLDSCQIIAASTIIMKYIPTVLKSLAALAMLMSAASCASNPLQEEKRLAFSAGFKVITPAKPEQVDILKKLPENQVTPINYKGKTWFILPDAQNNEAFVGGQIEFRTYQKLRMNKERDSNLAAQEAAEMAYLNDLNWGAWNGWGTLAPMYRATMMR